MDNNQGEQTSNLRLLQQQKQRVKTQKKQIEALQSNLGILKNNDCTIYDYSKLGIELLTFLKNIIVFGILSLLVYIIVNMYTILLEFRKNQQENIDAIIDAMVSYLLDFLFNLPKKFLMFFGGFFQMLHQSVKNALGIFSGIYEFCVGILGKYLSLAGENISTLLDVITLKRTDYGNVIAERGEKNLQAMQNGFNELQNKLDDLKKNIYEEIADLYKKGEKEIDEQLDKVVSKLPPEMQGNINKAREMISQGKDVVWNGVEYVYGKYEWLDGKRKAFVNGTFDIVKKGVKGVGDVVQNVVDWVSDWF